MCMVFVCDSHILFLNIKYYCFCSSEGRNKCLILLSSPHIPYGMKRKYMFSVQLSHNFFRVGHDSKILLCTNPPYLCKFLPYNCRTRCVHDPFGQLGNVQQIIISFWRCDEPKMLRPRAKLQ